MNISLLNERITIEKSRVEIDKIGNHKNVWAKYYSCYATISGENPQEQTSSGAIWDESKIDFTIRYSREVADISSIGFRVVFQDRKSTRLNSSHANISYAVFCLKKKKKQTN